MDALSRIAASSLALVPTPLLRKVASRYVAGERLEEALAVLRQVTDEGYEGILDILGEEVSSEDVAKRVVRSYEEAADAVRAADLPAYVSVKPTHVGLALAESLAQAGFEQLAAHCRARGLFLRVEMEDHTTTSGTLRVFERLRRRFDNVGIVLQSRLHRTPSDIEELTAETKAAGRLDVRLVKGIYLEPPEIAHTEPGPICDAYVRACRTLFERGARLGLATHDEELAQRCLEVAAELGVPPADLEFQVLLGVRPALWRKWREAGYRVRVYVPFGPDWRPYSLRRLRHNPQIVRHVLGDLLSFGRR